MQLIIFILLLFPSLVIADIFDTGCPCGDWPGLNCSGTSFSITVDDPMPIDNRECGNNGTSTITMTLSAARTWGCYADEYHIWIEDAGSGVTISATSADKYMVDPDLTNIVNSKALIVRSGALTELFLTPPISPSTLNADSAARPISLTLIDQPGWGTMSMSAGCSEGNYGDEKFVYTFTIVDEIPADNGETEFRPEWYGTVKTSISTNLIDWSFLPTHDADDAGMPVLLTPSDAIPRCVVEGYYFNGIYGASGGYGVFNQQQYPVDANHKYIECATHIAFSQGNNAPTLQERKRMAIGLISNGLGMRSILKNIAQSSYTLNSGYGHNAGTTVAFAAAAIPSIAAEFKNRFSTSIGIANNTGYEFSIDGGMWRHGNGNVYFGWRWYNQGPGSRYNSCSPGMEIAPFGNNSCRDWDGDPDDYWPDDGYLKCCISGSWFGQVGVAYAFPKMYELIAGTDTNDQGGRKYFDIVERLYEFGSPEIADIPGGSAHIEGKSLALFNAIKSCSRTLGGTDASIFVDSYDAGCDGHTLMGGSPMTPSLSGINPGASRQ